MRIWLMLMLCLLMPCQALAEADFLDFPWSQETAPAAPMQAGYAQDGSGYHDGSLDIEISEMEVHGTPVMLVRVKLASPVQFRTALAAPFPSRTTKYVANMARKVRAVLAVNADNFSFHSSGIVMRNAQLLRFQPDRNRDTLVVDREGNFRILSPTSEAAWEEVKENAVHAFCFGPALVVDGEERDSWNLKIKDLAREKKLRRIAIGQTGPLEYLILASRGPEDEQGWGLTLKQLADLCYEQGCLQAYNLDGGVSTSVVLGGEKINTPGRGPGRAVGDMIWFATIDRKALADELDLELDELLDIPDF